MDRSLAAETVDIYRREVAALAARMKKYEDLDAAEIDAIVGAFAFAFSTEGQVRAQQLYERIHRERGD